jgi:CRISPR-associated endonuclease Csn1
VQRAVQAIVVSHKPDHSHEGRMHNDTAYGLLGDGLVAYTKHIDGQKLREPERLNVIEMAEPSAVARHGVLPDGKPRPYKGYKGDSNYCIEIVRNDHGKWEGEVISTFQAYQVVRSGGIAKLRDKRKSVSGKPLVMRLIVNDFVTLTRDNSRVLMRVATISGNGQIFMARPHEANVDARNRNKSDDFSYTSKMAGSLQTAQGRQTTVSPIGLIERN